VKANQCIHSTELDKSNADSGREEGGKYNSKSTIPVVFLVDCLVNPRGEDTPWGARRKDQRSSRTLSPLKAPGNAT